DGVIEGVGVLVGVLVGVGVGVLVAGAGVADGVGVLVGVGVLLGVGVFDGVAVGAPGTVTQAENSDVSWVVRFVAVAVMKTSPGGNGRVWVGMVPLGVPLPAQTPVVIVVAPRNVFPSPLPLPSQLGLEKNSIRKSVLEVLLSVPETCALPEEKTGVP